MLTVLLETLHEDINAISKNLMLNTAINLIARMKKLVKSFGMDSKKGNSQYL
jgi:hypothetical protein